jgi:hypothetical protein
LNLIKGRVARAYDSHGAGREEVGGVYC